MKLVTKFHSARYISAIRRNSSGSSQSLPSLVFDKLSAFFQPHIIFGCMAASLAVTVKIWAHLDRKWCINHQKIPYGHTDGPCSRAMQVHLSSSWELWRILVSIGRLTNEVIPVHLQTSECQRKLKLRRGKGKARASFSSLWPRFRDTIHIFVFQDKWYTSKVKEYSIWAE